MFILSKQKDNLLHASQIAEHYTTVIILTCTTVFYRTIDFTYTKAFTKTQRPITNRCIYIHNKDMQ